MSCVTRTSLGRYVGWCMGSKRWRPSYDKSPVNQIFVMFWPTIEGNFKCTFEVVKKHSLLCLRPIGREGEKKINMGEAIASKDQSCALFITKVIERQVFSPYEPHSSNLDSRNYYGWSWFIIILMPSCTSWSRILIWLIFSKALFSWGIWIPLPLYR